MPRSTTSCLAVLLLVLVLVGACGVGAVEETTFVYGTMGSEGGTLEAGDVTLTIPPGALAQPTAVVLVPEEALLPIDPPLEDPCEYSLPGPRWCCGPCGQELLEDGYLVVHYDVALIPEDADEEDLVLLLWDHDLRALVLAGEAAEQDLQAHCFVVAAYRVLGRVAVGLRSCPQAAIAALAVVEEEEEEGDRRDQRKSGSGSRAQRASGLYVVTLDGTVPPLALPTGEGLPVAFLPSPDGSRVLFNVFEGDKGSRQQLWSVTTAGERPTLLAGEDENVQAPDPTYGWMHDGARVFFQEYEQGEEWEDYGLSTVPGDGSTAASRLYEVGAYSFVEDLRQSIDGDKVLIVYYGMYEDEWVDVFDAVTGVPYSQGVIPVGSGHATPRFLPDSSGVYLVDDYAAGVVRYDLDGTNPTTLYTLPEEHGYLKDFVLAPNGDDFAYVARVSQSLEGKLQTAGTSGSDGLYVGSLSGGVLPGVDLGGSYYYDEMFFHPDGTHILLDTYSTDVRIFRSADGTEGPDLHVAGMSRLDICARDGRLLLVVNPSQSTHDDEHNISRGRQTLPPGLYVADADGSNQLRVPTPEDLLMIEARWLRTVRRAPGLTRGGRFR